ncbi:MAG: hypothetical protein K2N72_12080 [Oscillospiraceae bacterium]|nr:hypothetical protein [Oscillospiraceae bacterium]
MAIGGIGSYSSYNSWLSGIYGSGYSSKKKTTAASNSDLQALMKLADEVRSPAYRKKMNELFSSSSDKTGSSTSDGEIGSVSSELNLANTSDSLKKAASSLSAMSAKDIEDGDALVSTVKKFTEAYNSTIDAMGKSDSVNALSEGLRMTDTVKMHAKSLKRVGITIGSDNKLSVDEELLKKADKNVVKSLFTGNYSPVKRIADRAEDITAAAKNKAQTTSFRNMLYGNSTSNSYGYGSMGIFGGNGFNFATGQLMDLYI